MTTQEIMEKLLIDSASMLAYLTAAAKVSEQEFEKALIECADILEKEK